MNVVPLARLVAVCMLLAGLPVLAQDRGTASSRGDSIPPATLGLEALPYSPDPAPQEGTLSAPAPQLQTHPAGSQPLPSAYIAPNGRPYAIVDGAIYHRPSAHDFLIDYLKDSYGLPALARTSIRTAYAEARGKPTQWDNGPKGIGERFGSSEGITLISGNTRYGMEVLFHEDLRYYPCHRCGAKAKIENALLAEITARHDVDGHRFFTLTPTVADFSGPIVAHTIWYPGSSEGPFAGVVSARTYFATRIGSHIFQEFVLDRRHHPKNPESR